MIRHIVSAMRTVSSTSSGCLAFASWRWPLRLFFKQGVVVGVKQDAHCGAVAHVGVEADDGDVVNDGWPHHASNLGFADGDLLLETFAVIVIDAFVDEHVAEVALPMADEVAEPEVIRKVAEVHVEALVRDVRGEGLDVVGSAGVGSGEFGRGGGGVFLFPAR